MLKSEARIKAREFRKNLSLDDRRTKDEIIKETFFALPEVNSAKNICVYISARDEVSTIEIINTLLSSGKTLSAPKTDGDIMYALEFTGWDNCKIGNFKIVEPTGKRVDERLCDLIVVPLVAFNKDKARIGYGKGYYDKFLPKGVKTVGLAYAGQCFDFEPESFDKSLDLIVTEKGVVR